MADADKNGDKPNPIQGLTLEQLRRRRWLKSRGPWVGGTAGLLVLGAVAIWLLYFSSVFAVKHVVVDGLTGNDVALVENAAHAPMNSPLINANLGEIQKRVEALRWVASATVTRSWPQTVKIEVTPRTPVAVVKRACAAASNIDASGVLFVNQTVQRRGVPSISVPCGVDHPTLVAAATAAGSLPPAILRQVTAITVETMDSITLDLTRGRHVFWGSASDSSQKSQVAVTLLHKGFSVINVSIPSLPTTGGPLQ